MDSASVVFAIWMNAPKGMALAELAETDVFGVVPEKLPPFNEVPVPSGFDEEITLPLGCRVAADGV